MNSTQSQISILDEVNNNLMSNYSTKSSNVIVQETRQKAAKMLISVVIIFTICYIPVHVFNLFRQKKKYCTEKEIGLHDEFRYIYTYIAYVEQVETGETLDECSEQRVVNLERTGTTKIVTISALISHFLPYFNSSINPIIYNIMSGN